MTNSEVVSKNEFQQSVQALLEWDNEGGAIGPTTRLIQVIW